MGLFSKSGAELAIGKDLLAVSYQQQIGLGYLLMAT